MQDNAKVDNISYVQLLSAIYTGVVLNELTETQVVTRSAIFGVNID